MLSSWRRPLPTVLRRPLGNSCFYTHSVVSHLEAGRRHHCTKDLRNLMEVVRACGLDASRTGWTAPPMWPRPPAPPSRVSPRRRHCPAGWAHSRFPTGPLRHTTAITASSPTGTGKPVEADHRSPGIRDLKLAWGVMARRQAAWLIQVMAHNLARCSARSGCWRDHRPCSSPTNHPLGPPMSSPELALGNPIQSRLARLRAIPLGAVGESQPKSNSRHPRERSLLCILSPSVPADGHRDPMCGN